MKCNMVRAICTCLLVSQLCAAGSLALFISKEVQESQDEVVNKRSSRQRNQGEGAPLSPSEFQASKNLIDDALVGKSGKDPTEGDLFEGDIKGEDKLSYRNGVINSRQIWDGGIVPYTISSSFSPSDRLVIANAIDVYHSKTCLKFVPKTSQHTNWVNFETGGGCSSYVGKSGRGAQGISLGRGCVHTGIVQHEMMHAIGFWHEQSRHDRDEYVTINWNNIQSSFKNNFEKVSADRSQTFGQPYDYGSVMHYGSTAFAAKAGQKTIVPKQSGVTLGQRRGLSKVDIAKIRSMYKCGSKPPPTVVTTKPPVGPKECKDKYDSCGGWAKRMECDKNSKWMKKHCPVSCHSCDLITKSCKDQKTECKKWSETGLCENDKFSAYMTLECPESCNVCSGCD